MCINIIILIMLSIYVKQRLNNIKLVKKKYISGPKCTHTHNTQYASIVKYCPTFQFHHF